MTTMPVGAAALRPAPWGGRRLVGVAWAVVGFLPLLGLVALLAHGRLDPGWTSPEVHFSLFSTVGLIAAGLALGAGGAATRRGDARVLLLSCLFLATGGFMAFHALGTTGILFDTDHPGFKIAIPVGLLVGSVFAAAASFVDLRPHYATAAIEHERSLRQVVFAALGAYAIWTLLKLPPLDRPASEGARGVTLSTMAAVSVIVYACAAARFWWVFRARMSLLPASIIACFVLLTEAMVGVASTGERAWHASWWLWHGLIVLAFALVAFAARRQWSEERFRPLYLETTRERTCDVSVVFSDLASFTTFSESTSSAEVAAMLNALHGEALPLITTRYGGVVERLTGDGMIASFGAHGRQPDHAERAARAALAVQEVVERLRVEHPGWPRLRVGVNTGQTTIREMGGDGCVAYELCGDAVNTGARLESSAPVGGVLIGSGTFERLPRGAVAERRSLLLKGKEQEVDAYLLTALPAGIRAR